MRMYICERLRIAGFEQAIPFSPSSFERIYEYTGGVPRLINIVCDTCLGIGCETKRMEIGDDIVEEARARHELPAVAPIGEGHAGSDLKLKRNAELNVVRLFGDSVQAAKATGRESCE